MSLWKRWSIATGATLVGTLYLYWKGPVPVVRVSDTLPIDAPFWYMLSAFPALGLLLADLADLARERRWRAVLELAAQILVMVALSHSRLELRIPISGHSLLFTCFMIRRAWLPVPAIPWRRLELALGAALLAMVAAVKLLWWGDPVTLAVGVLAGLGFTWVGRWLLGRDG